MASIERVKVSVFRFAEMGMQTCAIGDEVNQFCPFLNADSDGKFWCCHNLQEIVQGEYYGLLVPHKDCPVAASEEYADEDD